LNKQARIFFLITLCVLMGVFLVNAINPQSQPAFFGDQPKSLKTSELMKQLEAKNVATVKWQGERISGTLKDTGQQFTTLGVDKTSPGAAEIVRALDASGAEWNWEPQPPIAILLNILSFIAVPVGLMLLLWLFVIRPAQAGGNQAMSFGRSRARRVSESTPKITFEDVAGIDEAKQELYEIVDFLKNTKKYSALGAKIPKGILLTGPPGVGKTYLARAIAGEAGVPFFHISGSDFVEMFVGVGAARVRDLFETAKAHRPSLIFIDEIDAVGRQRGAGLGGGHDEREQTLNQMLVEMDGFDPNSGVIMIAATNRPDVLDPALLRPGRFDRQIVVDAPDANGRLAILKIHAKGKPFDGDVDLGVLSRRTPGFTGADLANMLNEAALLAARRGHSKIAQLDLEEALDRVMMGPQRRSRVIDAKEREVIAYHEAGHAVLGEILDETNPTHKVTILPRGMALGVTMSVPEQDKYLVKEQELIDNITMTLGGRVAEEIRFGEITTGASHDLEQVTRVARAMVCEYGMSKRLGTLAIGRRSHNPFLGRDLHEDRNYSEEVARVIDEEVRTIVDKCLQRAHDLLNQNRHKLDAVVAALLQRETLDRQEFLKVMAGEPLPELPRPSGKVPGAQPQFELPLSDSPPSKPTIPPRFEPDPA
jgi:cell division protease FtsH